MPYSIQTDIENQLSQDELIQLTDDRDNLAAGALNGALTASGTTITLQDGSGFPPAGRIMIGTEEITYTGKSTNDLTGCTRGANNTTAQAHATGQDVTELNRIDSDVITRAIADADAEIDSYCASQYEPLPFSPVPVMVRKLSVDIAIYHLYARRKGATEERKRRYDEAIRFLRDAARGNVLLGSDGPAADDDAGPAATTDADDRIFSSGKASDDSSGTLDNY